MRFNSPSQAKDFSRKRREEITRNAPQEFNVQQDDGPVDPKSSFYVKVFEIQNEIEKERKDSGGMDYVEYSRRLWKKFEKYEPDSGNKNFALLQASLVERLHNIGMNVLLYPHVLESLGDLLHNHKDEIQHLSIWSQGDVEATGYQAGKIADSRIIEAFFREVVKVSKGKEDVRNFIENKTSYEVAGNKFENLVEYLRKIAAREPHIKLVIIEDQLKNFSRAHEAIEERLGKSVADRVEIIPIWAMYSREGLAAQKNAGLSAEELKKTHTGHNPIESFAELIENKKLGDLFKDAHVFVDFDGVLANNVALRDAQASATLSAAIDGFSKEWGMDRVETKEKVLKIATE